jgi:hypothetical protein
MLLDFSEYVPVSFAVFVHELLNDDMLDMYGIFESLPDGELGRELALAAGELGRELALAAGKLGHELAPLCPVFDALAFNTLTEYLSPECDVDTCAAFEFAAKILRFDVLML